MAVVTAAEALAYINREGALPNEAALVSKLEEEEPAYTYHSYQAAEDGSGIPASGPENLSVSRENDDQGSVCGLSNSGKVYCARVNRTGLLIIADSNPSDNPLGAIVANANPLAFLNPESAAAVSQKEREDRKMSICSGDNETEVRGCLADSILDALEIDPEDPPPGEDPLGPVTDPDPDPGTEPEEEEEEPTPPGGSDQFVLSTGENIVGVSFLQLDNNSQIIGGAGTNDKLVSLIQPVSAALSVMAQELRPQLAM